MTDLMRSIPERSPDIAFQSMPPETILLNLANGYYYSTNELGGEVWQRCDGETTVEGIIRNLLPKYDVDLATLSEDVAEFIRQLAEDGLLVLREPA